MIDTKELMELLEQNRSKTRTELWDRKEKLANVLNHRLGSVVQNPMLLSDQTVKEFENNVNDTIEKIILWKYDCLNFINSDEALEEVEKIEEINKLYDEQ